MAHPLANTLQQLGGLRPGHTAFKNGMHGDGWVEKGALISQPGHLEAILQLQGKQLQSTFPEVEVLVGSAQCGATLATLLAKALGLSVAFTYRDPEEHFHFHRMFVPPKNSRLVLIEDLIFSGRDVRDQARFFAHSELRLLGVSAWMARSTAQTGPLEICSLLPHPFNSFATTDCPFCQTNQPLVWSDIRE